MLLSIIAVSEDKKHGIHSSSIVMVSASSQPVQESLPNKRHIESVTNNERKLLSELNDRTEEANTYELEKEERVLTSTNNHGADIETVSVEEQQLHRDLGDLPSNMSRESEKKEKMNDTHAKNNENLNENTKKSHKTKRTGNLRGRKRTLEDIPEIEFVHLDQTFKYLFQQLIILCLVCPLVICCC